MQAQESGASTAAMHRTAGRTGKNRAAGLTVLELLITLTVASVLTSIAIPSYQRINAQNRLATSTNQLLIAMVSARQAAVTRNAAVTFCAGNPDDGCDGDWSAHQWIVRSEEHTSELQSLMRISYAVFCLTINKIKASHNADN